MNEEYRDRKLLNGSAYVVFIKFIPCLKCNILRQNSSRVNQTTAYFM